MAVERLISAGNATIAILDRYCKSKEVISRFPSALCISQILSRLVSTRLSATLSFFFKTPVTTYGWS
ncbi:hypothetical protein D3C85_1803900 [compost metagenome]